jgi:hypothetical protein
VARIVYGRSESMAARARISDPALIHGSAAAPRSTHDMSN